MSQHQSDNSFLANSLSELNSSLDMRPPFLFLDRDGTLVPIADNPEDAVLDTSTFEVLRRLSGQLSKRVAIVSARGLSSLTKEFDTGEFILAGNYGLEICFPSGQNFIHPEAEMVLPLLAEVRFDLAQMARQEARLIVDDHKYSFCLHLHKVPLDEQHFVVRRIGELEQKYSSLRFKALPTSYEIGPAIEWSKASALDIIIDKLSLSAEDCFCMAFGDSPADEPMFHWVNRHRGLSFAVGKRRSTEAVGSFDGPADLIGFLESLLLLPL